MAKKFVEQKLTKWWHAFTELKSWVQIAIAIVLVVIVHNYVSVPCIVCLTNVMGTDWCNMSGDMSRS